MDNKQIYKLTLGFSLRRVLWDVLAVVILFALTAGGFLIADKMMDKGLIGLVIGLVVGIIVIVIILRYISYTYKAGQIAMMTKALTEGRLPDDVIGEGKRVVKERFLTVAAFYAVTNVIKGIFNEIGRGLTKIGGRVGGDTGNTVASVISSVIQVVINYLSDCCLGWVFYRKNEKAARATCEGAVLFFKHGKTFAKNMGRVFGMGIASLAAVGGVIGVIAYLIFSSLPAAFETLTAEITEAAVRAEAELPAVFSDPKMVMIICAALCGIIVWSIVHSVFIRPFVLVGVLRNYLASGMEKVPSAESFIELDKVSPKFKKLHAEASM